MLIHQEHDTPLLPKLARTSWGFVFDPQSDVWSIASVKYRAGECNLNFSEYLTSGPKFHAYIKLGIVHFFENYSWSHAHNIHSRFLSFYRCVAGTKGFVDGVIDLEHLLLFRSELNRNTLWKLGVIRIFLLYLDGAGLGISTKAAIRYLRAARIPGNPTGTDVRTRDSERGAFSTGELEKLRAELTDAYRDGRISLQNFALAILFLSFGPRPIQVALLKEGDFTIGTDQKGNKSYTLLVPRAKQHDMKPREALPKPRRCAQNVGRLLEMLIAVNSSTRSKKGIEIDDPPLFFGSVSGDLPDLHWHATSTEIGLSIIRIFRVICPDLKANPKRFRHTLAQRLADAGVSKYIVADLLDHTDASNVGVYFEATPHSGARISRKVAIDLAPLAQAFRGTRVVPAVTISSDQTPGGSIYDWALSEQGSVPLGGCGQTGSCGLTVPRACYTCVHMRPFLEGPHEEELKSLLTEREELLQAGFDEKIVEILDRTILGVAEVISDCEEIWAVMAQAQVASL